MTEQDKQNHDFLKSKFNAYRKNLYQYTNELLSLVNKEAEYVPFTLNRAQQYIHLEIEKQKKKYGYVRVIILKGRQQGSSKYCNARFVRNATLYENQSAYIMAHDAATTNALFDDCKKMYNSIPSIPVLKPNLKANNARILEFGDINSKIVVGTAGSGEVGRGTTINKFHGSEVAFWPNGDNILAGVLQAVPLKENNNTEVILESTANGVGNKFYSLCIEAIKGKGAFKIIFIPWWWTSDYILNDQDIELGDEDEKYYNTHMKDFFDTYELAKPSLKWRKTKIVELGDKKFKQEYPATPEEAFQMSGENFFDSEAIYSAAKSKVIEKDEIPLVLGIDAAEKGGDRTAICFRRGKQVTSFLTWDEMDEMKLAGIVGTLINKYRPHKVFFDKAYARGCIARLEELGYGDVVEGIHFGSRPIEDIYLNKRAEMHHVAREWINEGFLNCDEHGVSSVSIPDNMAFITDLLSIPEGDPTSNGKLKIVSKADIKKVLGMSTDLSDAFILTFAKPVMYHKNIATKINIVNTSVTSRVMGRK